MKACLLLACRLILCELFAQDWPNFHWGRFNGDEVNSINTLQVMVLYNVLIRARKTHYNLRVSMND